MATANANAVAGDTVNLRAGTYTTEINPAHSGTATLPSGPFNRITFQAYLTEVPVIAPAFDGIDLTGLSYIRVTGITFTFTAGAYRLQSNSNHNEIDHCVFNSTAGQNLSFLINTNGSTNWSTHNWVHDNTFNTTGSAHGTSGTGCTDGGGDTLDIGVPGGSPGQTTDLDNNNTIENNVFNHSPHASTDNFGEFTVLRNNVYHNEPWSSGCTHTSIWPPDFSNVPAAYSGATTYTLGQTATSGGQIYVSITNSNLNNAVTNTSFWQKAGTCTGCVPNFTAYNGLYAHRNAQIDEDWGRLATYVLVEGNRFGYSGINDTNGVGDNFDLAAPQNIVRYNFMYASMNNNLRFKYQFGNPVGSGGNGGTYNRVYNNTLYMSGYGYPLGLACSAAASCPTSNPSLPQSQTGLVTDVGANSGLGNVLKNNIIFNGDGYSNWGTDFVSGAIGGTAPPYTVGNGWLDVLTASNNWCSGAQPSGTPAGACTATGDPLFTNPDLSNPANTPDLSLKSSSPAINGGTFLTTATNAGSGSTSLTVADALYFQDGTWGSDLARSKAGLGGTFQADWIAIGTVSNVVQIASVAYGTNTAPAGTITLANAMTWSNGAHIWLFKKSDGTQVLYGTAPDYGASEFTSTAVPVICPNKGQVGLNANCIQPATLTFGKQGINTASMAVPATISNSGQGSFTLAASSVFVLSGTNASDFAVTPNGCTANLVIGGGGNCVFNVTFTPTATVGTNETATLTANYAGGSLTMSLTGTSATVTTLGAITSPLALTAGVNYQLTQDISCATSCFTVAAGSGSFTDLNGNGHTITWCTGTSTNQEGGVITRGNNWNLTVHNITINQGGGSCTGVIAGGWGSGAIIGTGSNGMAGTSLFNANLTWSASQGRGEADNYAGSITGFATVIHDVVYTDNDPGNCNAVGCRSQNQFFSFTVVQAAQRTAAPFDQFYNNTAISGGPQGAFNTNSTGANCSNNLINLGNSGANATVANGYVCQDWGDKWTVQNNLLLGTGTNGGIISGRGIQLANVSGQQVTNSTIQNNTGIVNILNNDAEYNCNSVEFGATYGIQIKVFGSGVMANNTIQNNNLVTQAGACGAYGFSTTNDVSAPTTGSVGNVLKNNNWTCVATAGFTYSSVTNCAGMRIDYAVGNATPMFSSNSDTVTGDSSDLYVYFDGSDAVNFNQDTFVKPSTAVTGWVWIDFTHGLCCASSSFKPGPWTFTDPVFTGGATESNTNLATWATNNSTSAFSYTIKFTQRVLVKAANNGKSITGASCVYTDALSNTYSATSDLTGTCTVVVNENKYSAASGTLTTTHYNNYQLVVSNAGCTTSTQTGLNITTTNTTTVQLAGCGGNVDTALPPTFFGFDQLLFGTGHENTGLVYGWQRAWDSPCVWGLIEVTAGVYNFDAQCHAFVQSAVNHNAGVQFVMGRTPASRITGTCSGNYSGNNTCAQLASDIDGANTITPAFINAWASYMSTTWPNVKWRIEGRNESDLSGECAENSAIGGHCSMVHLVKEQQTIYNTVKALTTANTVLCPAASTFNHFGVHLYGGTDTGSPPFTGSGFAAAGGLAFCDIMNVHPYFFAAGATCNPVTTGSNSACVPEEAVNGSFTCAATSTTMSGGLGQINCLLAANNLTAMPVESSETNWGKTPPNILFANGGLSDTQRRQYIGRYIMYALNADQQNVTWYTWECNSGNLAVCFGTLSGSGVSGAALTALGIMQDWLIGAVITSGTPCTIVSGTTWECALIIHTASGKSGNAEIVFDNSGATPTISAFGATRAYRLDNTNSAIVGNQITLDGEPTLLFPLAVWSPGPNCRDYQNGSSQNGRSYNNGATTANGRKCP